MYLIRLDDASEYMDINKWNRMEKLLDKYNIKPIVGVIPDNRDESLVKQYNLDEGFWDKVKKWQYKEWEIALHGYDHICITQSGGINPINPRSEFAGVSLDEQKKKIKKGLNIFKQKAVETKIFFAPSHTFDTNTIKALKEESNIRIISDTIANDIYKRDEIYFIPQQSGEVRKLPFKITTFCYHPNTMNQKDFLKIEEFLQLNHKKFVSVRELELKDRKMSLYDVLLNKTYFILRSIKSRNR